MSTQKKITACFSVVLAACILIWAGLLFVQPKANSGFDLDNTNALEGEVREEGNVQIFSCILPEPFEDSQSLLFKSSHAAVEIMLGDTVVYTFGTEKPVIGKSPGTHWHVVSLPENSEGQELVIRQTSAYSFYKGSNQGVSFGSRGDCILKLLSNFLYVMVLNAIIFVLGIISLLLHLRDSKRGETENGNGFLWIGIFSLMISIWSLRQSGALQFLIPYSEILYFIDIHLLFLVAAPLDLFVSSFSKTKWGKGCLWFVPVYLAGVVIGTVLQAAGVMDLVEMLRALHVFIGVNAAYMFFAVHLEALRQTDSAASRFRIPLYTIMAFGVLEIFHYYTPGRNASVFLPTGVMVFILMLIWQQVEAYHRTLEEQRLLYYEKLANTDMLTGALNRNAYETTLKNLSQKEINQQKYGVMIFDLNELKVINDNFGHEKGDEAIKRCYDLILTAFGDKGNCYRIGGDEFLLLGLDDGDIEEKMAYFDQLVERSQERLEYPFSVAFGYAEYDAERDRDLQNTIRRSDAVMYLDKKKKKQQKPEKEPAAAL